MYSDDPNSLLESFAVFPPFVGDEFFEGLQEFTETYFKEYPILLKKQLKALHFVHVPDTEEIKYKLQNGTLILQYDLKVSTELWLVTHLVFWMSI